MAKGATNRPKKKPAKKTAVHPVAKPSHPGPHNNTAPLVAIGASAGGLEAIIVLLENLPAHTGASFVILQHFAPDHETMLPHILDRKTRMKVDMITPGMLLEEDHVYVMPPNVYLGLDNNAFTLSPRGRSEDGYHAIDRFLSAVAPIYQNKAIAIILSGAASDGTAGVRAIKAEGGITFAQDNSAKFQGMPHSAIESGYIDFVLSPQRISGELQTILNSLYRNELKVETLEKKEDELRKIHMLLLNKHDVDFSLYKQTTIIRRIIRRISLNRLNSLEQYIKRLSEDSRELDLLHRDLLINVTSFFREPALYVALTKKIFPALLKERRPNDPIRIWIPACATGEEPYSIAICFFEYLKDKAISTPIQIFSTDLSETAINKARAGIYGKNALINVSPQRVRKFFVRIDGSYQIIKPIRDICVFATHNLLKDPPFSRMDMISCQNVLIYMEQAAQKKIMQAFNYALKPGKYLILGKSETVGSSTDLFDQVDKDLRIYSRKTAPSNMHFGFSVRSQAYSSGSLKDEKLFLPQPAKDGDVEKEAEKLMLALYTPASILVNKDLQILRFYGSTFPYLQPASGKASLNLLKMIRDELIFELRTLVKQVRKEGRAARRERVQLNDNGQLRDITLEVQPIMSAPDQHLLIIFQPSPVLTPISTPASRRNARQAGEKDRRIESLEKELQAAREHVKSMTEDFEATREELQSANEEVLSSNEELQSINEELETSKEELQSTNEELITINEELQLRNNELKEAFDYTRAIIETIREPLLVLNTDLHVLTANPAFNNLFNLSQGDAEGNYLYDIADGIFDLPALKDQLKKMTGRNSWIQDFGLDQTFSGPINKRLLINAMRINGEPGRRARILLAIEENTVR